MSSSFRTPVTQSRYDEYLKEHPVSRNCPLCEKVSIQDFTFWKVTKNDFPYDRIADIHHMILPRRHVTEENLNQDELQELQKIKSEYMHPNYEWILEAAYKTKSIPNHFHLHLITTR